MSEDRTLSLEQLLAENPFLREIHARVQADPFEAVLPRLAIPRSFNQHLYNSAIRQESPLTFEQLIDRPEVRAVPDRPGFYWLSDDSRDRGRSLRYDARVRAARVILEQLNRAGSVPIIDRLTVLCFAEPELARLAWIPEFEDANARNDFAELYTHDQAMECLLKHLPPEEPLAATLLDLKSRYAARNQFLREWHRTATYYPRRDAEKDFHNLVSRAGTPWIFQLYAAGGMGKTMFLEAQIARRLLVDGKRPLVARIDLDFISVNNLVNIPWLIAIEIGRQLDLQLPVPRFRDYLTKLQPYSPLLYSPQSDRYRSLSSEQAASLYRQARQDRGNWDRFVSLCASLPEDRKVVLVLDTVEEASLYFPAELRKLLTQIEEIYKATDRVRLVLSGRYHLGVEHLKDLYDEKLRDATTECTMAELLYPDDADFIRLRLPDISEPMLKAVLASAKGYPFKLALLAELLISEPTMKVEDLAKHKDADVAFLIQRVIRRIQSPGLRWLVRYGSVPRRLSRRFVRDVMVPHLERALKGEYRESQEDAPEQDAWYPDPNAERDPDRLWEELTRYSSERGWINLDPVDPDLASFHPDVVIPTRRLLSTQKVYQTLQKEAADFAAKQAETDPQRAVEHRLAEFFHRVQLPDADLDAAVLGLFERFPNPSDRITLANEILKHRDFAQVPRRWPNLLLAEAFAAAMDWRFRQTHSAWSAIRSWLIAAKDASPEPLPRFFEVWLNSDTADLQATARTLLTIIADCSVTPEDRLRCILLFDEVSPDQSTRLDLLEGAIDPTRRNKGLIREPVVRERLGLLMREMGNLTGARDNLEAAWRGGMEASRQRVVRSWVDVSIDMSRSEAGHDLLMQEAEGASAEYRTFLRRQQARFHLEVENPWGALALLRENDMDSEAQLIRATAFAQQLRVSEALELFRTIEASADQQLREAAIIARSRLLIKETGLEGKESLREIPRSQGELEILRTWGAESERTLDLTGPEWRRQSVSRFRALLMRGAAPEELGGLSPASARLRCLDWPALEPGIGPSGPHLDSQFLGQPTGPAEAYHFSLRFADLLCAMGQYARARQTLNAIVKVPPRLGRQNLWPLMAFRRRRQIEDRIAEKDASFAVELDPPDVWKPFEDTPLLYQACLVELAQRAMRQGDQEVMRECLKRASGVEASPTRYGAIYRTLQAADRPRPAAAPVGVRPLDHATPEIGPNLAVLTRQSGRLIRWTQSAGKETISVVDDPALESAVLARSHGAFLRLLGDQPAEITRQLDEVIDTPWIVITDSVLCGLPWEHSTIAPCRFVPDNPGLRASLRRGEIEPLDISKAWLSQSSASVRRDHVILYVTPRQDRRSSASSMFQRAMYDLSSVYKTQVLNPWMEDGGLPLPTDGISVLHLGCGIEEISGVPTLLDLNMPAAALASRLRSATPDHRPIVILDPPRPVVDAERLECLLVRNRFAQELAETGTVEAVLATGLAADEQQHVCYNLLLEALKSRAGLEATCRRIQHSGDDLSFRATALFACNPLVRLP